MAAIMKMTSAATSMCMSAKPLPFNMMPRTRGWVRRAGLRILESGGKGHYLPFTGRPPIELPWLDRVRPLGWLALHSYVIAQKT